MRTTQLENDTQLEVNKMLEGGMILISPSELNEKLDKLGYKVDKSKCFNYQNKSNEIHYAAKHVNIVHKDSEKCFSNVDSPKNKLKELQEIRRDYFVFEDGVIWEL